MALAHCTLDKFLGVVCHCFPSPLDVLTFAARCLYVRKDARDPSSERWNWGRESCPVILPKFRLPHKFRDILHAANLRHGTDCFTSPPKEGVWGFFRPKNLTASAGFEPANLGTKGQHATPRTPKPLSSSLTFKNYTFCPQNIYMFRISGKNIIFFYTALNVYYNRGCKCLPRSTDWVLKQYG